MQKSLNSGILYILFLICFFSVIAAGDVTAKTVSYPNIGGGGWVGNYYIYDPDTGVRYDYEPVTATISVDSYGNVDIFTSFTDWREYFYGDIDTYGDMYLWDPWDGELWTTYFYLATPTFVHFADCIDLECSQFFIINLQRSKPDSVISTPTLVTPEDGAVLSGDILAWQPDTSVNHFDIQVGPSCSDGTIDQSTDNLYQVINLEVGSTYYWKVRGVDEQALAGDWSSCRSFSIVEENTVMLPPILHLLLH